MQQKEQMNNLTTCNNPKETNTKQKKSTAEEYILVYFYM